MEESVALIKCPECERDVSSKATACPHCGYPIERMAQGPRPVQVIEQTGRRWKAIRALGRLVILVGLVVLVREFGADDGRGVALGWWICGAGVACLWMGRAGAWWYHG